MEKKNHQNKQPIIFWSCSFLPTKAFTLVCRPIHKHFGGDDITERQEHLHQLSIPKLLREVVDEQVAALWSCIETEKDSGRGDKWRDRGTRGKTGVRIKKRETRRENMFKVHRKIIRMIGWCTSYKWYQNKRCCDRLYRWQMLGPVDLLFTRPSCCLSLPIRCTHACTPLFPPPYTYIW